MPIDILDQPRGGILETIVKYILQKGGSCSYDSLIECMSGNPDGRKYLERNCIDLLTSTAVISAPESDEDLSLKKCPVLEKWKSSDDSFETYFKVELLSKIVQAENPYVRYFSDLLGRLFDLVMFDTATLEVSMKEARQARGLPVTGAEELSAKVTSFCPQFLSYFNMLQKIGDRYYIYIPKNILKIIITMALEDINKPSVRLYSELFERIDTMYLPVLERKENRLLRTVLQTVDNTEFLNSFKFSQVPDGGRSLRLNNKEYNAIITR